MSVPMTDTTKDMFKIGDKVFQSSYGRHEKWVTCPDCLGSKRVTVVLGDGTEVKIECGGCYPGGYESSLGVIRQYDYSTQTNERTVTGICMRGTEVSYELNHFEGQCSYYHGNDTDTFATREEALAYGESKRLENEADENKRLMAKTKDHKSWAWNATYHRREIKRLERDLEHHRRKVQICAAKAKEPA